MRAIRQAAERILLEEGPDGLNTNRIAEVAGVNVGSLYRYFPNKEAIVAELYEEWLGAQAAAYEAMFAEGSARSPLGLSEALRLVVDCNADMHVRMLSLHGDFYRRHQAALDLGERAGGGATRTWLERVEDWLAAVLRAEVGGREADVTRTSFTLTRAVAGALRAAARERPELLEDSAFRAELEAMARALVVGTLGLALET